MSHSMAKIDVRLERLEENRTPQNMDKSFEEETEELQIETVQDVFTFDNRLGDKKYRKKMVRNCN